MSAAERLMVLGVVETDRTFRAATSRGERVWAGRCLGCNGLLAVAMHGEPITHGRLEHILPQSRGGTSDPGNLALACDGCTRAWGGRGLGVPPGEHPAVERLLQRRRDRWRDPLPAL